MSEIDLLQTIKPIWMHRALQLLTRGTSLREDLTDQLGQFFEELQQAVETGDPAWLDTSLNLWSASLTQTDLESDTSSLSTFINELLLLTFNVCRETLDGSQSLDLIAILIPLFIYALEKSNKAEIQARTTYISNKLEQTQQSLERLDRTKSDFIAVAAHELKTPLTLIEGYAAMLRENCEKAGLNSSEIVLLDGIQNGTNRLHDIVDDLIDVSLLDNNLLRLNLQPVWINRLLKVLENEFSQILKERRLTLTIETFPGSNEMTFGDPERLLQLFRNLIANAIKYTPDGGKVAIGGRKLPGFIEVTVMDTGIGIALEDQQEIFKKFGTIGNISLHSSGKTKFKGGGPGLGLHIAKGITESHGGAIWVESPGYNEKTCPGSTFHVLLPILTEPQDEKMAKIFAPLTNNKSKDQLR